jgi:glycosyltransferase involved in cell wall biosynthesis
VGIVDDLLSNTRSEWQSVSDHDFAPLRILLTIHHDLDLNTGAPGSTLQLGKALRRQGHQVSVVGFDDLPTHRNPRLNQLEFPIYASAHVRRSLSRCLVDVVEASTGDLWLLPRIAITKARAIVVTRSHGLEHLFHLRQIDAAKRGEVTLRRRYFVYHGGIRLSQVARSLRIADISVFNNALDRQWAIDNLRIRPERSAVAGNGVAPEFISLPLGDAEAVPRIAILGGFMWWKGAETAATVLSEVLKRMPSVGASWLGADPAEVARALDPAVRDRVRVLPRYELVELPSLLRQHEILLFLSRTEGFGNVVIEAMACGLVPVASDIPGPRDILNGKDAGMLVPVGDVRDAVDAVNYLLQHREERQRMRQRAHILAQDYSYDAIADGRVALYRRVLGDKLAQKPRQASDLSQRLAE